MYKGSNIMYMESKLYFIKISFFSYRKNIMVIVTAFPFW
jgi:hypothetical protein